MRMNLFTRADEHAHVRCVLCPRAEPMKAGMPAKRHAHWHIGRGEAELVNAKTCPRYEITDRMVALRLESDRLEPGDRSVARPDARTPGGLEPAPASPVAVPLAHATPKAPTLERAVIDDEDEELAYLADADEGPVHELNFDHGA
jgi:hypothetical protein